MAFNKKRIFKIISAIVALFIIFFIMLLYLGFLDWKKTLITKMTSESTIFIGQDVAIEDLSLSLFKGLTLKDISVRNPKGFDSGNLLYIEKLYLKTRYRDLVGGTFHFDRIAVTAPELTLMKDKDGNLNISEKLRHIFKGEGKSESMYHIDEFKIDSGTFEFKRNDANRPSPPFTKGGMGGLLDENVSIHNITVYLKNISSDPGEKMFIEASVSFLGSIINLEGWAHLKDELKTFALSISSDEFNPVSFKGLFERIGINSEKIKVNFNMRVEGDMEETFQFTSQFHVAGALSEFLNREIKDIQIETDCFVSIHEDSVRINSFSLRADDVSDIRLKGIITGLRKDPVYTADLKINRMDLSVLNLKPDVQTNGIITSDTIDVKGEFKKNAQTLSGTIYCMNCGIKSNNTDSEIEKETLVPLTNEEVSESAGKFPYNITAGDSKSSFKGTISADGYHGNGVVHAKDISVSKKDEKRNILKDTVLNSEFTFKGSDVDFNGDAQTGKIVAKFSGTVKEFKKQERSIAIQAHLPEIEVADIRNAFWDIFPDSLLYAGLDGYVSSHGSVDYSEAGLKAAGDIRLRDFILEGENGEYSVGQVNGIIPVIYSSKHDNKTTTQLPPFKRSDFEELNTYFSKKITEDHYRSITIGSLRYGFKLLDNIKVLIDQEGDVLDIRLFKGDMFGGKLYGSARVRISNTLQYKAGIILTGLSLTELCEEIEPIKGYLSGMINGVVQIKGSGGGFSNLIGKGDFWTYKTEQEETKISKEFLHKIGGPSLKTYLGDRSFDKGEMALYLQDGFIIFHELEIENKNFVGMKDLSIKVAPLNNRISIDHLLWTMAAAAQRAKKE